MSALPNPHVEKVKPLPSKPLLKTGGKTTDVFYIFFPLLPPLLIEVISPAFLCSIITICT
jgi:hypothetical protein